QPVRPRQRSVVLHQRPAQPLPLRRRARAPTRAPRRRRNLDPALPPPAAPRSVDRDGYPDRIGGLDGVSADAPLVLVLLLVLVLETAPPPLLRNRSSASDDPSTRGGA